MTWTLPGMLRTSPVYFCPPVIFLLRVTVLFFHYSDLVDDACNRMFTV